MARAFWTDEKVDTLKKLVDEGHSYSYIGSLIGCSRNACIGKALRIGISNGHPPGAGRKAKDGTVSRPRKVKLTPPPPKREKPPAKPVSPAKPVYEPVRTLASGRTRIQLPPELWSDDAFEARIQEIITKSRYRDIHNIPKDNQCKYIHGDPKHPDSYWCRMDVVSGSPYCHHHIKLMYEPRQTGGRFKMPKYPQLRN